MRDEDALVSKGSLYWRGPHPDVTAARRLPGWAAFHRACGKHGLYFEDIDLVARRRFGAVTFREERRRGHFLRFKVSDGFGPSPVAAVIAALDAAVAGGFSVPAELADLLRPGVAGSGVPSIEDMLG